MKGISSILQTNVVSLSDMPNLAEAFCHFGKLYTLCRKRKVE